MKTASVKEIKTELENTPSDVLLELCMRLTKFKKENKELLTYLLFEQGNEQSYVASINTLLDQLFETVNKTQLYFAKKTIRKIVRTANRYIKYSSEKTTEPDVLLHVCMRINELGLDLKKNAALYNLYNGLVKKINKAIAAMHEEEQYDYKKLLDNL
jgi:methionyl-tRNA synthetase